ncbi:MAG: hypothetical protein K8F91_25020, partial [Candidatus Obscuribacterales bacterium]|nr:hypothetical protein [Candidatus Obscuribacterales bacterium]
LEQYQSRMAQKKEQPQMDAFGIEFGDGTVETSKGTISKSTSQNFFEPKGQEVLVVAQTLKPSSPDLVPRGGQIYQPDQLIAANVTPEIPNIGESKEFQEIRTDESPTGTDSIAWDGAEVVDSLKSSITLLPDYLIGDLIEQFGNIQKTIDSLPEEPIRGHEMEVFNQTTKEDPQSWSKAQVLLPELKNVPSEVLKAYTLNELYFYNKSDLAQDVLAGSGNDDLTKRSLDEVTLGVSQITPKGLRDMCSYFPQLKEFMTEKGYAGNEQKALLDPSCIPMIVAAKTALIVRDLGRHHIPVNTDTVGYSYNADVHSYSDGHGGREYKCLQGSLEVYQSKLQHWDQRKEYYANNPRVAQESKHLGNIKQWLKKLK